MKNSTRWIDVDPNLPWLLPARDFPPAPQPQPPDREQPDRVQLDLTDLLASQPN